MGGVQKKMSYVTNLLDTSISFYKRLASPLATDFTEDAIKRLSILHMIWIVTCVNT